MLSEYFTVSERRALVIFQECDKQFVAHLMHPRRGVRAFLFVFWCCVVLDCRALSYTFHALTGGPAGGTFLIDDDFGYDRMSFYAETPLGTFNQPLDYLGVANGEASSDTTFLFVGGGALSGAVFSDIRTFLGPTIGFNTDQYGICTWSFSYFWQDQEYTAGGTGIWARNDLDPGTINVSDNGQTASLLIFGLASLAFVSWQMNRTPARIPARIKISATRSSRVG